jgi:hypothetical protein
MQLWHTALQLCLLASATIPTAAASSWGFTDATVSVQTKGAGVGSGLKEKYSEFIQLHFIQEINMLIMVLIAESPTTSRSPNRSRSEAPIPLK